MNHLLKKDRDQNYTHCLKCEGRFFSSLNVLLKKARIDESEYCVVIDGQVYAYVKRTAEMYRYDCDVTDEEFVVKDIIK